MNGLRAALAVALAAAALPAQARGTLRWIAPAGGVVVGEPFAAELDAAPPADVLPAGEERWLGPVVLTASSGARLRAVAWAAGEHPPAELALEAAAGGREDAWIYAAPALRVRSVLLEPDRGVEWPALFTAEPRPWRWWGLALGLAAVLAGAWAFRRSGRRAPPPPMPAPDPVAAALAELAALPLPLAGADAETVLGFYTALAGIVRAHAGRRGAAPAMARTSEELCVLARGGAAELRACLAGCDAVKFAAARPGPAQHAAARAAAVAFVEAEGP